MKTLSLTQPWASLVASGDKRIETRSFSVSYRGPLAIHASKGMPDYAQEFCLKPAVEMMLTRAGFSKTWRSTGWTFDVPRGAVIATCQLVGCASTDTLDLTRLGKERILGDFRPGRFAWYLEGVMKLPEPIPARGSLGLWEWDEVAAGVEVVVTGRLPLEL